MKKNVALMIPELAGGGAERVVSILSRHLQKEHSVYVFIFDGASIGYPYGGTLINLDVPAKGNFINKIVNVFKRVHKVKELKKDLNIDVCISFLESANIVNILSRKREKIIISLRSYASARTKGFYNWIFKFIIKKLYNTVDYVVSVSQEAREDLIENFRMFQSKTVCIYNPVDTELINDIKKCTLNLKEQELFDNPIVINVGRLNEAKGQYHLIKAFYHVKQQVENAKLVILGEGKLRKELQDLIKKLDLENSVYLLGFKENPYKYMFRAKVFVLSSLYEGFPNVLLEAMACGLAIVSTNCKSGPVEILQTRETVGTQSDGSVEIYGILTTPFDVGVKKSNDLCKAEEELANNIEALLKNEELRLKFSQKSLQRVNDFKVNNIIKEWTKLI